MLNSIKLFLIHVITRVYLTVMATTPMIRLTQNECRVLLDAYAKHGVKEVRICYALVQYGTATPDDRIALSVQHEIMKMLTSGRHTIHINRTADDLKIGYVEYRVKWINQLMAYNNHPNKLHILRGGKLHQIKE